MAAARTGREQRRIGKASQDEESPGVIDIMTIIAMMTNVTESMDSLIVIKG
jgi:hypothetical protein